MAVSTGAIGIGTAIAAGAGATAAAIRAARTRAKPNQTPYGASEDVYGQRDPNYNLSAQWQAAAQSYQQNVAALGPRPPRTGGVPSAAEAEWDAKKAQLDSALQTQQGYIQQASKSAQEQVLQTSGYDAAVNPLLDMQRQSAQVYGTTLAAQGGAIQDAQSMGLSADQRAAAAAQTEGRSVVGQQDVNGAATGILAAYQPGRVSEAAGRAAIDQVSQANLGGARAGGALGLRNALNANGQAGVDMAGQIAAQRAAEEERYLGAQVGQANLDRSTTLDQRNNESAMQLQADEAYRQRILQNQNMNYGISQAALGARLGALDSQAGQAIQREGLAATSLGEIRGQQLSADINYDTRRQAEQQRKSNNLWGLAGGLVGIASGALGSLGKK